LTKVDVIPNHEDLFRPNGVPQGGEKFTYTATGATLNHSRLTTDGKMVESIINHFDYTIRISGYPDTRVLKPGDKVTVEIDGTDLRTPFQPNKDGTVPGGWGVTADVSFSGLKQISGQPCWAGSFQLYHAKCSTEYVFEVPQGADKVTITLKGNFGINGFATYTWEKTH
jgi:hypothetical protein